jgi:hypothetical protein
LPGCAPQKVRFWKSHENDAKSSHEGDPPDLPIDRAVDELLVVPELREPQRLAASEDLLHLLQRAEARVIAQIAAVAVRPCDLDRAAGHNTQLCQIERSAKGPLIGVGHLTPLTARCIAGDLAGVAELEIDAGIQQPGLAPSQSPSSQGTGAGAGLVPPLGIVRSAAYATWPPTQADIAERPSQR